MRTKDCEPWQGHHFWRKRIQIRRNMSHRRNRHQHSLIYNYLYSYRTVICCLTVGDLLVDANRRQAMANDTRIETKKVVGNHGDSASSAKARQNRPSPSRFGNRLAGFCVKNFHLLVQNRGSERDWLDKLLMKSLQAFVATTAFANCRNYIQYWF